MLLTQQIQAALSRDLLRPQYQNLRACPYTGHCYVASEVLYHLYGKQNGYTPACMAHENTMHWFLRNKQTGQILDITVEQFQSVPNYKQARGCGFLTREPSKRAQEVMRRIDLHGSCV